MNATLENILIGGAGAVFGVLVMLLGDEIKGWLGWFGYSNRDLRGEWCCTWYREWPQDMGQLVDTVEVLRAGKREVLARGLSLRNTPYNLCGTVSQANVLTLTYEASTATNLSGTVIVKLDTMRRRVDGFWLHVCLDRGLSPPNKDNLSEIGGNRHSIGNDCQDPVGPMEADSHAVLQ